MQRFFLPLLIVVPLVLSGCNKPLGALSGTVTLQGLALDGGVITFYNTDKDSGISPMAFEIGRDGTYNATGLPFGSYAIGITNDAEPAMASAATIDKNAIANANAAEAGNPQVPLGSAAPAKSKMIIPEKYIDPLNSGITFLVEAPKADFSFELK
jgi:hypothetical protein